MPLNNSPVQLGVGEWVSDGQTPDTTVAHVRELSFSSCQIGFRNLVSGDAGPLTAALERHDIQATALMELGPGPMVWDFHQVREPSAFEVSPATKCGRIWRTSSTQLKTRKPVVEDVVSVTTSRLHATWRTSPISDRPQ